MCSHSWVEVNDVFVCMNCGMTKLPSGKIIFDREIANYKKTTRKKRGKKWREK